MDGGHVYEQFSGYGLVIFEDSAKDVFDGSVVADTGKDDIGWGDGFADCVYGSSVRRPAEGEGVRLGFGVCAIV